MPDLKIKHTKHSAAKLLADLTRDAKMMGIKASYSEPHRRYHTWRHIEECRQLLREIQQEPDALLPKEYHLVDTALLWHDIVYDPRAEFGRNELHSALFAYENADIPENQRQELVRLILLTTGHKTAVGDPLGQLVVSIDLAILGSDPVRYAEYAADIRAEYAHVSDWEFAKHRSKFLLGMASQPVLYPRPDFERRFGGQARKNMISEAASLL